MVVSSIDDDDDPTSNEVRILVLSFDDVSKLVSAYLDSRGCSDGEDCFR